MKKNLTVVFSCAFIALFLSAAVPPIINQGAGGSGGTIGLTNGVFTGDISGSTASNFAATVASGFLVGYNSSGLLGPLYGLSNSVSGGLSSTVGFVGNAVGLTNLPNNVNVKDFGAVGNGVAYDDSAIQSAEDSVNSAGGGTVNIPAGIYLLQKEIWLKDNVSLRGAGRHATRLLLAAMATNYLTANVSAGATVLPVASSAGFVVGANITLRDSATLAYGTGDSCRVLSTTATSITVDTPINGNYTTANGAGVYTSENVINIARFQFLAGLPVNYIGYTNCSISDMEIDGNSANNPNMGNYDEVNNGIHLANSHYVKIERCFVHNCQFANIVSGHFVDSFGFPGTSFASIQDNYFLDDATHGPTATIRNNLHFHFLINSVVANNILSSAGTNWGAGIWCNLNQSNIFSENLIGGGITNGNSAISLLASTNCTIMGTIITGFTNNAIYWDNASGGITLSGVSAPDSYYLNQNIRASLTNGCTFSACPGTPLSVNGWSWFNTTGGTFGGFGQGYGCITLGGGKNNTNNMAVFDYDNSGNTKLTIANTFNNAAAVTRFLINSTTALSLQQGQATFAGSLSLQPAAIWSVLTNGPVVYLATNNVPNGTWPEGSIATRTDATGGIYLFHSGSWVSH